MMHGYWGGPMGFGWMGGIFMLIFWAIIIIGIVWLVRYIVGSRTCFTEHPDTPLEILKKRYAKGEIDKKEFEEKKKDLGL
jgi:putative membrane protein